MWTSSKILFSYLISLLLNFFYRNTDFTDDSFVCEIYCWALGFRIFYALEIIKSRRIQVCPDALFKIKLFKASMSSHCPMFYILILNFNLFVDLISKMVVQTLLCSLCSRIIYRNIIKQHYVCWYSLSIEIIVWGIYLWISSHSHKLLKSYT